MPAAEWSHETTVEYQDYITPVPVAGQFYGIAV